MLTCVLVLIVVLAPTADPCLTTSFRRGTTVANKEGSPSSSDCLINIESSSWPAWPPIITDSVGDFILPTGTEDDRHISLPGDSVVRLSCPGTSLAELPAEEVWARCGGGDR